MTFRTPSRRKTRQRSGFNVIGDTSGSECKIKKTGRLNIDKNKFKVTFSKSNIDLLPLFENKKGILFFGAYIKPKENLGLILTLKYKIESVLESEKIMIPIHANHWNKVGILANIKIIKTIKIDKLSCDFELICNKKISTVDFFGINMGAIDYKYLIENEVEDIFYEKLNIYIPEISYHKFDEIIHIQSNTPLKFLDGEPIVIKSCNRCSRFLPIDVLDERNTLSFSNHCVKRVPCAHNAFSRYLIKTSDYKITPKEINALIVDGKIRLYHGYQLECKPCKKFFVNAPLNPLRNSTQHREDSLRRRAIEVLVDTLLGREWIYHKFRMEKKKEFDNHIWDKFGKKCFKCDKLLKTEREMNLDHTMPLASFWPLDESATCLCEKCNSLKSDKFPIEFYSKNEIKDLSKLTGLSVNFLSQKNVNKQVIEKLIKKIDWFFDDFLDDKEYQKIRNGKRTSDLIYKAILKQIHTFYNADLDLVEVYKKKTGKMPKTITL